MSVQLRQERQPLWQTQRLEPSRRLRTHLLQRRDNGRDGQRVAG